MSFRCKQKFVLSPSAPIFALEDITLETGIIEQKSSNLCNKVLPEPELFNLDDNIKAGVNLKEVSSVILSSKSVSVSDVIGKEVKIEKQI